jgi:hypothetical protein
MASLLSGETGRALVALIKRDQIIAGPNIKIHSRDENGTFLSRTKKKLDVGFTDVTALHEGAPAVIGVGIETDWETI